MSTITKKCYYNYQTFGILISIGPKSYYCTDRKIGL